MVIKLEKMSRCAIFLMIIQIAGWKVFAEMRCADYIFEFLAGHGVEHVFLVTGGGAMHLNDALRCEKRITPVCNLHEQGCAIGAEGYARISGKPGVICVTSGPGGTNALTGVAGAWLDSIPMVIISGQVKTSTLRCSCPELNLRQLGDQELNIVDVVKPITKYAVCVKDAAMLRYHLEKAWYLCRNGRPGPVWLDIPLNIQAQELLPEFPDNGFDSREYELPSVSPEVINEVCERLKAASRPVIVAGNGIRLAGAAELFLQAVERLNIPVLTAISGTDLLASEHPLNFGRPGILGARAANFILQNCDCLLVLGSRMGLRTIGYAYDTLARDAFRIMVDIDPGELAKPTFRVDCAVNADLKIFLTQLLEKLPELPEKNGFMNYCRRVRDAFPVILEKHRNREDFVSSYLLPEIVAEHAAENSVFVTGNGTAYTSTFQTIPLKKDMRLIANVGCASMGWGLPAAIGAALVDRSRPVVLFTGDGSIQMNIQELQTVKNLKLKLKCFVYNNDGYLSIKLTQRSFFNGNFIGSTPDSGIVLPDMEKLAWAYGIDFYRLRTNAEAAEKMPEIMEKTSPVIVEVMTDPFEELGPKAASKKLADGSMVSAPLEDLFPFLERAEFEKWMIVEPVDSFTATPEKK